jgi:hypothetical protein
MSEVLPTTPITSAAERHWWRAALLAGRSCVLPLAVDIEAVIAALPGSFSADEVTIIERMLRELNGTIADAQMVEEIALALAVHRRR